MGGMDVLAPTPSVRRPLFETSEKKYTKRAEIIAYMIYLEGPEYPEYVMHIFYLKYSGTPKYGNVLGNPLPVGPAQQTTENYLKYSGGPQ